MQAVPSRSGAERRSVARRHASASVRPTHGEILPPASVRGHAGVTCLLDWGWTMSYRGEISRASPTAIVVVIDQSTSMGHTLSTGQTKSSFLADVLNKTLYTIITNCSKADGVRDYFHIGIIAYGGDSARNGFCGRLGQEPLQPVSGIAEMPLRVETRTKTLVGPNDRVIEQSIKFPIWFEPRSRGKTATCAGLNAAIDIVKAWCSAHPNSFPPTVLHITDGHPTDGNPEPVADRLKSLGTEDGRCLLFNLHVDVGDGPALIFPNDERVLKDRFDKTLFRMSSVLPPHAFQAAKSKGYDIRPGARAFVFNAGIEAIVDFFDIGTRPVLHAAANPVYTHNR
jgi:hypothetical protein